MLDGRDGVYSSCGWTVNHMLVSRARIAAGKPLLQLTDAHTVDKQ